MTPPQIHPFRFAVIWVPQFPLQSVLRSEPLLTGKPVVAVDPARTAPIVEWMTDAARKAGVEPGQTPAQALARCPSVTIRRRSIEMESAAQNSLIGLALALSPWVEWTQPGVCTLDLRGQTRLTEGTDAIWEVWMSQVREAARGLGLDIRLGIAATPGLGWHAARWGNGMEKVINGKSFLSGLPIAALQPSSDVEGIVAGWGIRTVGEFLALGQAAVTDRLGLEALALWAAASPDRLRPLRPVDQPVDFREFVEFEAGLESLEPLLFRLKRMLDSLEKRLEMAGFVAGEIDLRLNVESGEPHHRRLRVPHPTRRAELLFRMIHTHLENIRTQAPVISAVLDVVPARPHEKQFSLFETALKDPHQFQETLARLSALVGHDRVGTPVRKNTHCPDQFRMVPPDFEHAPEVTITRSPYSSDPTWRILRPAPEAGIRIHDGSPQRIDSPGSSGTVRHVEGPWKSSGHWWETGQNWTHESWEVVLAPGRRIRVARFNGEWRVEAVGD